jgi:hypothetical protein
VMRAKFGIKVAEDTDPNGFGHSDILNYGNVRRIEELVS